MKSGRRILLSLSASLVAAGGLCTVAPALAQNAPPSYIAAPDVYKLVSENEQFRVILATWKPGQRDAWHSHLGPSAVYRLTDCSNRAHTPDGKVGGRSGKRGDVAFNAVIPSHSLENIGTTECQVVIVERK
jgi:hypothetical protein